MGVLADALRSMGGWLGPYGSGDKALLALFAAPPTASGQRVSEYTALNLSAVWCAVTNIASGVAGMPLNLYKRLKDDGKEPFVDHPVFELLHARPNPETGTFTFRETLTAHALTFGNAYAEIQRDATDRPVALWQITPDRVEPFRNNGGALRYRVRNDDGTQTEMASERMLHVPGLGWDGVRGYSVISKARETLGLTAGTERFGASFFAGGSISGGVAMHPGRLSPQAKADIAKSIEDRSKEHRVIVLEENMKFEKTSIPPDDAQFLETRKFQVTEIARWFNIPPHKLKDLERATFSNIEEQSQEYIDDTLMPWLLRWEQELDAKLISRLERKQQFFKHNVKARLRGNSVQRAAWYAFGRQWGIYSANDVLRIEDENPIGPEGDIYLVPTNMAPADRIHDVIDAQVAPKPAPAAPTRPEPPEEEQQASHMARLAGLIAERLRPALVTARVVEITDVAAATAAEVVRALPPLVIPPDEHLGERLAAAEQRISEAVEGLGSAAAARLEVALTGLDAGLATVEVAAQATVAAQAEATAAYTEIRDRLEVADAARQAQAAWRAELVSSLGAVVEAALRTEIRFEADRARKAAQTPEKLGAWMETFYPTRAEACLARLLPVMRLPFIASGRADQAEVETRRLVTGWVEDSRATLATVLDHVETLEADVDALVTRWEVERPSSATDALMREVIHV